MAEKTSTAKNPTETENKKNAPKKRGRKPGTKNVKQEQRLELGRQANEMRKLGVDWESIVTELGPARSQIVQYHREYIQCSDEDHVIARATHAETLDKVIYQTFVDITKSKPPQPDLKDCKPGSQPWVNAWQAWQESQDRYEMRNDKRRNTIIKAIESKNKLLGLNAPTRVDTTHRVQFDAEKWLNEEQQEIERQRALESRLRIVHELPEQTG